MPLTGASASGEIVGLWLNPTAVASTLGAPMRTILCAVWTVVLLAGADDPGRAGRLVLVAGGGTGGDGSPADQARLASPFGVGFDTEGAMFLVELTGQRVRKVGTDHLLTTVAGTGQKGDSGDGGPAAKAEFNGMHSLAVARNGDIYLADTWNNRVRKIDVRSGLISNVAGTGRKGFSGDGGPATEADPGGV